MYNGDNENVTCKQMNTTSRSYFIKLFAFIIDVAEKVKGSYSEVYIKEMTK